MKMSRRNKGSIEDMIYALQDKIDELEGSGIHASTEMYDEDDPVDMENEDEVRDAVEMYLSTMNIDPDKFDFIVDKYVDEIMSEGYDSVDDWWQYFNYYSSGPEDMEENGWILTDIDECDHSVNRSNQVIKASTVDWQTVKDDLENDLEGYRDPIDEETGAGNRILFLMEKVERKMGVWLEPSVQGGQGGIWVRSSEDNSKIAGPIDYAKFNSDAINLALTSNSRDEFQNKYESYLQNQIDSHLEEDIYECDHSVNDEYDIVTI